MSATHVVVDGTVKPDGSLELDSKLELPPRRVQLIVQPLPDLPEDDPFWQMMKGIWAARRKAELTPRHTDEIEEQRRALRDDADEEIENAEALQEESKRLRKTQQRRPGRIHDRLSRREYCNLPRRAKSVVGTEGFGAHLGDSCCWRRHRR